ncbi:hypothetical protein GP486_003025 [Trichoglossum hirsutum]|uniref:Uncharacterized protein n=1 Tax=Trichoglossum hirsutum TaxID=265104 RepID=A0A9P8RR54_9PEZI|nr:hypothetical protein GP486_003025 [Trichoglossum hirsutum]
MSVVPVQPQQRSRPKSTWSFVSNMSSGSRKSSIGSTKSPKADLRETTRDKQRTRFGITQDPTRAISEDEPFAVSQRNANDLRALPHKDQYGNLIVEPDRSNPTRPRWERPLDTIRSFEAAIDNEYRRKSYGRADSYENTNGGGYSRRSSYYAPSNYSNTRGLQDSGYYGSRPTLAQPESFGESHNSIGAHYQNRPRFGQRVNTEPPVGAYSNGQNVYPSAVYQQSADTVNTASGGSHSTDPWAYSTDPSSEDSSIDRRDQGMKVETVDSYGHGTQLGTVAQSEFVGGSSYPRYPQGNGPYYASNNSANPSDAGRHNQWSSAPPSAPPHLPPKDSVPPRRVPIKLGNASSATPINGSKSGSGGKRKSWFKRFSRGN